MEQTNASPESSGKWLRRIGRKEFTLLMGACIEGTLSKPGRMTPPEARRMRWEVMRRFETQLLQQTRRVRALTRSQCLQELERSHGKLLRERARQGQELVGLERELARVRGEGATEVLGPEEEKALSSALERDLRDLLQSGNPAGGLEEVLARESLRRADALARVVARERERIDVLERRLAKLRSAQDQSERAMEELARRAEIDGGLPSIYRHVQGLRHGETGRETKAVLLAGLFDQNWAFQKGRFEITRRSA